MPEDISTAERGLSAIFEGGINKLRKQIIGRQDNFFCKNTWDK